MEDTLNVDDQDIAIVGVALRFPGASNASEYWRNLRDGVESVQRYTDQELADAGVPAATLKNPNYVKAGAPLDDMAYFDPEFFGFSPREAGILDPQHRQFYECAWEALEDAGHPPELFDGAIGVFAGCGMGAYFAFNLITNPDLVDSVGMFLLRHTGNDKDFLSSRVSYSFDLKGPSINVQTACSTSLVATHLACQSLLSGECDMALAGGSTIEIPHRVGYLYKEGEILSPDGHCRAFDHRAKGTIFGSGTGLVVLRRMDDALRDGDQIYAVVKGTAVNNDGSGKVGYLAPSVDGQAAAIVEAMAVADVDADSIDYVECHGTGTPVGDPIEVSALTQAFRESSERNGFCGIGSVKTNIGHLDTAAGVASLIKASLALKHGQLPPSLNYEAPNPTIDFAGSPFYVNDVLQDWPQSDSPRRAGVNSLGVGGTNAFAVLEQPPAVKHDESRHEGQHLIVLSARNRKALDAQSERLAKHLDGNTDQRLEDVAYTLLVGRRRFEHRRVLACSDRAEAVALLRSGDSRRVVTATTDSSRGSIVFMFPGGGAQYSGMALDLYQNEPVFKSAMDRGLDLLKSAHDIDLRDTFLAGNHDSESATLALETPSVQLPVIFIVEHALVQLWHSRGIEPSALIGHSMGENTAACVAGVLSYEDALGLVRLRGQLMDKVPAGGMLSVELPAEQLDPYLGDSLDLASINSPLLSVATGATAEIDRLMETLVEQDIEHQRVRINIAAHSRMLEGILEPFEQYLTGITLSPPKIPFISNRSGTWITDEQATSPKYWVEHLRNTVRFSDGIETLLQDSNRVLIEVGPGHTLGSLAKHHAKAVPHRVVTSLRHPDEEVSDESYFSTALGKLWMCGVDLDPANLWPGQTFRRVSLPTYAFQRSLYWIEPGKSGGAEPPQFAQLEKIEDFDKWFYEPVWLQQGILAEVRETADQWLVFLDEGDYGSTLVSRLRSQGHDVVTVREGDAYYRLSSSEYRLSPELGAEGYQALAHDLVASGKTPDRILHLWLLTTNESFRPGSSFFHRSQEYGFYSLFFLVKAFANEGIIAEKMHWIVLSNGMQRVDAEDLPYPDKATVLGPCRIIPREFSGMTCVSVDLDVESRKALGSDSRNNEHRDRLLDMLQVELGATPSNAVVAYRNGSRWEQRFKQTEAAPTDTGKEVIRENGIYFITGGLGGVGFEIARYLGSAYQAHLVLVNRTPLPDRSEWSQWLKKHPYEDPISRNIRKVQMLEDAGARVSFFSGDVTNVDRMKQIVETVYQQTGKINGVFHTAGIVKDSLVQAKTQAEIEEVFTPKVYGTMVLDQVFEKEPLDFMLLFSSTSTLIAPMGQLDYVAANSFMNAYAHHRTRPDGRRTIAVNWGVWNEVGMAAEAASQMGFSPVKNARESRAEEARHQLFEKHLTLIDREKQTHLFSTHLSPQTHWLLDEHRTSGGQALVPGTAYIEMIRAALVEIGEKSGFVLRDLYFFRALAVADNSAKGVRVKLRTSEEGYIAEIQSERSFEDGATGWERHAEGRVLMRQSRRPDDLAVDEIAERCGITIDRDQLPALKSRQEAHLNFGARWQVLCQQGYGNNEAVAHLMLPELFKEDLKDFKLHPALLDLATGHAMDLIQGYADTAQPEHLWVPVSYGELRYFEPLGQRVLSWVKGHPENSVENSIARFDITILDLSGKILVEVDQLTIKRLDEPINFDATLSSSSTEVEMNEPVGGTGELRQLSPSEQVFQHNLSQGILPEEGVRAIKRVLDGGLGPQPIVTSLALDGLIDELDAVSSIRPTQSSGKFSRPELDSEFVEPRDDIERTLVGIWEELLGVDQVGAEDSFFDLGGHSLVAVRLFARVKQAFDVDYPISILFEAPTVEACANLIRSEVGEKDTNVTDIGSSEKTRYAHLVPMHPRSGGDHTPFFLVAGMFGNVLNLRHLAHLVGSDRDFYGLQARGLYGDQSPHTTFEKMAEDYIREIQDVQPHGPYLLGGFSGGGITAFEMARQLIAKGEQVALLALLDTPLPQSPPLSSVDRISIHWQRLQRKGPSYLAEWAKNRYQWEYQEFQNRFNKDNDDNQPFDFQSEAMEVAFRKALDLYQLVPQPLNVSLFRPRLDQSYTLSGGRTANTGRELVFHDNGWTPYVEHVEVHEVPGDHDSMVLEPNVRVLAEKLRSIIEAAEAETQYEKSAVG